MTFTDWLGLALMAAAVSFTLLWLIGTVLPARRHGAPATGPAREGRAVFLFEDELLTDHDAGALPDTRHELPDWQEMRQWLSGRFADLPARLDDLADEAGFCATATPPGDTARVDILRNGSTSRVTLSDPPRLCPAERHAALAERTRLADLNDALGAAPHPVWKTARDGAILWQNAACAETFTPDTLHMNVRLPEPDQTASTRFSLPGNGESAPRCFEVHSTSRAGGIIHHATDVSKIVRAETAQREFVQTLTKTFAYLSIGLAVFDKRRRLALFNPALVDLTGLPTDFLSGQPDLMGFFDTLRNRQVMPEPRSYASWRARVNEVIESARGGLYEETWSLPNDMTYRVTGRPHPDGAIAFLFEDVTPEVTLMRRYRSQIELRQAALDLLPEAVVIIGPDGIVSFCNSAASTLLGIDPDSCFADFKVPDLMHACHHALPGAAVWPEVEAALTQGTRTEPLHAHRHIAGRGTLSYRVEVLPARARMLILSLGPAVRPAPEPAVAE